MKLIRILSSIINKSKAGLLAIIGKIIWAWLPAPMITYMKVWLPLLMILLNYFKIFNMLLGFTLLIGIMDLSNISISTIYDALLRGKALIEYNFSAFIDWIFKTKYTHGRTTIEINIDKDMNIGNIGNPDKDAFMAHSVNEDSEQMVNSPADEKWTWTSYLKAGLAIIIIAGVGYIVYTNYDQLVEAYNNRRNGGGNPPPVAPAPAPAPINEEVLSSNSSKSIQLHDARSYVSGGNSNSVNFSKSLDLSNPDTAVQVAGEISPANSVTSTPKASSSSLPTPHTELDNVTLAKVIDSIPASPNPFDHLENVDYTGKSVSEILATFGNVLKITKNKLIDSAFTTTQNKALATVIRLMEGNLDFLKATPDTNYLINEVDGQFKIINENQHRIINKHKELFKNSELREAMNKIFESHLDVLVAIQRKLDEENN